MAILGWIAILLLVLALFGTPLVWLYQIMESLFKFFFGDWWNRKLFFIIPDPDIETFLQTNVTYYQNLRSADKLVFVKRVQKFISQKFFEGRDMKVTWELEVLTAAAAVQITFGHPSVYFKHFRRIIYYPEAYYSTNTQMYHHGEVNPRGVIVLSAKKLLHGYSNPSDGRNLALHEMAHALWITDYTTGDENDFLDRELLHKFITLARDEMYRISIGEQSFFRDYAAANDHEFFAVAIENFFERAADFRNFHPELYDALAKVLNQ